jgi:hypothetical protein
MAVEEPLNDQEVVPIVAVHQADPDIDLYLS